MYRGWHCDTLYPYKSCLHIFGTEVVATPLNMALGKKDIDTIANIHFMLTHNLVSYIPLSTTDTELLVFPSVPPQTTVWTENVKVHDPLSWAVDLPPVQVIVWWCVPLGQIILQLLVERILYCMFSQRRGTGLQLNARYPGWISSSWTLPGAGYSVDTKSYYYHWLDDQFWINISS